MKAYVYPAGVDGCGYYRLIWPALALRDQGHDVVIVMPHDRDQEHLGISAEVTAAGEIVKVNIPEDADLIVLQRVTHSKLSRAIPVLRAQGVAVVVDMDDDLTRVHPQNPAYVWLHPKNGTDHNWVNATRACDAATWVTTSTPALQRVYARHGRGSVLYNVLEDRVLDLAGRPDTGCFGWTGSLSSHPDDPNVMGTAVERLVREGETFYMVGNPVGVEKHLRLPAGSMRTSGVVESTAWLEELSALHVGVAPLADSMFNSAKSWLKPLELAAMGVPSVMSPRAEYRRIATRGVGVLAPGPKDFYREVRHLLRDDAWYAEVRERSRAGVADLTFGQQAWRWAEAWAGAYELQRLSRRKSADVVG